jgi:tetratricopeptide (TPR) repeat protein
MNYLIFILSLILTGCASSPKNKKKVEVSQVKADDFKKPALINYNESLDNFSKIDNKSTIATNAESIQRLEKPETGEIKDILNEITLNCHKKDFTKAFNLIQENYEQYKQHPIFWNQVGTCYLLQGNRRKALLFFNKALEYKTSYAPAYNNLAVMYRLENEDPKALVALMRARKSSPLSRTPRFNLANLYLEYGLYNEALKLLDGLYNVASDDQDIIIALATAHLMGGNIKESLTFFQKLPAKSLMAPEVGINYSYALWRSSNTDMAKSVFNKVRKENLEVWSSYYSEVGKKVGAL